MTANTSFWNDNKLHLNGYCLKHLLKLNSNIKNPYSILKVFSKSSRKWKWTYSPLAIYLYGNITMLLLKVLTKCINRTFVFVWRQIAKLTAIVYKLQYIYHQSFIQLGVYSQNMFKASQLRMTMFNDLGYLWWCTFSLIRLSPIKYK